MADSSFAVSAKPDKLLPLVLDGLLRAAAEAEGKPLHGAKNAGLFPTSAAGRQAAQFCLDHGCLHLIGVETQGKKPVELYAITPSGLAFVVEKLSPAKVLEQIGQALAERARQWEALSETVHRCQAELETFRRRIETIAADLPRRSEALLATLRGSWKQAALEYLEHWHQDRPHEDCPLPELLSQVQRTCPGLTLGQFHDGLRRLHDEGQIYLHPWTGPLYEIPEPACALLVGHAVAYYASRRPAEEQAAA